MLVKFRCNRDHIYGLNWGLANKVTRFKILYMIIHFIAKFVLKKRGRLLNVIGQLYVICNWPSKLSQKLLNEISLLFYIHASLFVFIQMPLNGALGIVRLICSPVPHNLESSHKNTKKKQNFHFVSNKEQI